MSSRPRIAYHEIAGSSNCHGTNGANPVRGFQSSGKRRFYFAVYRVFACVNGEQAPHPNAPPRLTGRSARGQPLPLAASQRSAASKRAKSWPVYDDFIILQARYCLQMSPTKPPNPVRRDRSGLSCPACGRPR